MTVQFPATQINKYILSKSTELQSALFPLEKLDLKRIEGIQKDIPLFQTTSMEQVKFISKWFQVLNLMRGCFENCTFCLRNALKPVKENSESINTILWNDFLRFTEGFSKLGERLGVNPLKGNSHITLFEDSNMPVAKMKDLNGNIYSTSDALKEIYSKFQIPIVFVTSGWGVNNKFAQKTAEELCKFVDKNPECAREFAVSVNPFFYGPRDKYIEKVANALKTFLPLFKNDKNVGSTLFKHNYPNGKDAEITGENAAKKLYNEIYLKLQEMTDSKLSDYERLKPEFVTRPKEFNLIENKGRGQQFFSADEVRKNDKKLFVESFEWMTLTRDQKQQRAYECMTKNVDINGQIYLMTPSEQRISTNIVLNFINKDKKTAAIHTDKKFADAVIE